jgi:hypothetical protein
MTIFLFKYTSLLFSFLYTRDARIFTSWGDFFRSYIVEEKPRVWYESICKNFTQEIRIYILQKNIK